MDNSIRPPLKPVLAAALVLSLVLASAAGAATAASVAIGPPADGRLCIGEPITVTANCVTPVPVEPVSSDAAAAAEEETGQAFLLQMPCGSVDGEPIHWLVLREDNDDEGSGPSFTFTPRASGPHRVAALVRSSIVASTIFEIDGDGDGDGVSDGCDTCPEVANPDQTDSNGDGWGDVCKTPCEEATSRVIAAAPAAAPPAPPVAPPPAVAQELTVEEMAAIWGGQEKKCMKCDPEKIKCPAQTAADCECTVVTKGFITVKRCGVRCPSGNGYQKCVKTENEADKCNPTKTTQSWCTAYLFAWGGPGNPPTCPQNFDCNNNPGAGSSETVPGEHASCA